MTISQTFMCTQFGTWATTEVGALNEAVVRTARGLDPSAALQALKEAVSTDLSQNAASIAKAAAEGMGSEFTQGLIKASIDVMLDEISTSFPETKEIVTIARNANDRVFSIVQIIFTMIDNSPLVVASKTKKYLKEDYATREGYIQELFGFIESLLSICRESAKRGPLAPKIRAEASNAITHLQSSLTNLDKVRTKLVSEVLDLPSLENAKAELRKALEVLSPLDQELEGIAITTNDEIVELVNLGYSDLDIQVRILKAASINSFDFSAEAMKQLKDSGVSDKLIKVLQSIKSSKKKSPEQIVAANILNKVNSMRDILQKIDNLTIKTNEMLYNYQVIELFLDSPKEKETHARTLYERIINSCRSRVNNLIQKLQGSIQLVDAGFRPGDKEDQITDIQNWITEIAAILQILDLVKKGMYQDKKINANPLNKKYYEAYEKSQKAFEESGEYDGTDEIDQTVGFRDGINHAYAIMRLAQAMVYAKSQDDMDRQMTEIESRYTQILALKSKLDLNLVEVNNYLNFYDPEPPTPAIFDQIFEILQLAGMDRLYNELVKGNLECFLNMTPDMASYVGSAAECLKSMARKASNEEEKARFQKAAIKVDRLRRTRVLGNVQLSHRSIAAVKALKARILEINAMVKNLLNTPLYDVPTIDGDLGSIDKCLGSANELTSGLQSAATGILTET